MRRIMIVGLLLVSLTLILLFACGGDPAGVTSPISVSTPTSSTIWEQYQADATIEWNGGSTDNVSIKLLKGGSAVTTLASAAPNSGTYILSDRISPSWGTGTDFTIRVEDGLGEVGNSSQFEITVSSGENIVQVTEPSSSTQWQHYEEDVTISWSYPSAKAAQGVSRVDEVSTIRSTGTLSGDSVDIELYQGDNFVATLGSGLSSTSGSYTYAGPIPSAWGIGSDFKVRIEDNLGNYGFSSEFNISESSGQEVITVTEPTSSTEWGYEQTGTTVIWEYPDKGNSDTTIQSRLMSRSLPGTDADSVRIELWHQGSKVDDYSGWIANTGSYTRSNALPSSWCGSDYQIKVIDSNDNYGSSANFVINEPTGEDIITVTEPNSSTEWEYEQTGTTVVWSFPYSGDSENRNIRSADIVRSGTDADSVRIELWHQGSKVADYSGWIPNTGSYTRNNALPSSWCGSDYQIKVIDSNSNYGSSANFTIAEPSGEDIITVTEPNSSTEWEYEQTGTTVAWSFPYSGDSENRNIRSADIVRSGTDADSVRIELWHQGSKVADYSGWIPNTGSYTRNNALPSSWCGSDYQIKVIDSNSNYGSSANFTIAEPSGEDIITVTEPNSSTEWEYEQTGTTVAWSFPYSGDSENRNIRSADIVRSGTDADSVRIELWHQGSKVADYSGWIPNTGSYTRNNALPSSWCGSDYQIKVIDSNSNYGSSANFTIAEPSGEDIITVTEPNSSTEWEYEQTGTTVVWSFPYSGDSENRNIRSADIVRSGTDADSVRIELWHQGSKVADYSGWIPNTGSYTRNNALPSSWCGSDYQIKVIDSNSNYGSSANFTIAEPSGEDIITVTEPNSSTEWEYEQTGTTVVWSFPYSGDSENRNIRSADIVRSGTDADSVRIELWHQGSKVADYSGWIPNTGSYTRNNALPSSWCGSDYQIKVIDSNDNYGSSANFVINEPTGEDIITVTEPNSSTEWEYEQTGTTVVWSFPYSGDSENVNTRSAGITRSGIDSDNVRIEIWHDGVKLDDYSSWVPNTGSYTRNDPLPSSWGIDFNYQIKVIDENDNYGISENFLISGSIDVTTPDASTVWDIGETNTHVVWNGGGAPVKLEVWYEGAKVNDYSGWINNTGSYTRTAPIPSSWSIGEHFRIRVVESGTSPNDGYSEEFQIFDEVNVTTPDSETLWIWGEEGVTVQWSENYSDSVKFNVLQGGSFLASFSGWVSNTGSYTRTDAIPSSWGTGEDFQIKAFGYLGSTGLSEEFSIWAIDVTEPNSSTVWVWDQTNTQVLWEFAPGSSVRMEIWNDSKVDDYCTWTENDGQYTRLAAIPESWGEGDNFTLKMIDDLDNVGWSEKFSILEQEIYFLDYFDRPDASDWGSPDLGSTYEYTNSGNATWFISSNIGYMDDKTNLGDPRAISTFATTATSYQIEFSWKYEGGRGSGILLNSGSSHITGIVQVEGDGGKLRFYNGTSYVDIGDRTINVWRDYKLVVNGTTAKIYIDGLLELTTTVISSSVNNIAFWAEGSGNASDSWYDEVRIYELLDSRFFSRY